MIFKASGSHTYLVVWPDIPLTRNSAPTGCQNTIRWFSEILFAKLTVQFVWSCSPCVSKSLCVTTSISGPLKIFIPCTCHSCMGDAAVPHSATAGVLRHAGETQRESVLPACAPWNDTSKPVFSLALSFLQRLHKSSPVGIWWIRRETTMLYSICMRTRPNYKTMRGGSWLCKTCTKCVSLDYRCSSLWACLCIQMLSFSHEPQWCLVLWLKGNVLGFPLRWKSPS